MRIAVVGAGIGGLTLAVALSRAGLRCCVYEQAPELHELGAGIQLTPNAVRLLRRLELGRYLDTVAVRPLAIEKRRWDNGSVLARTALGIECEKLFGAPYYTLHRADLHRGLLGVVPAGTVRLGRVCTEVVQRADEVELHFADGSMATADVLVGADGIHSVVRQALVRDEPRFSGQTIYRSLVPGDRLPFLVREPKVLLWLGPDQHCVCYPVSGGQLVSFGATTPADGWHNESWSATGRVAELIAAYTGWDEVLLQVLEAADQVGRWALHDRDTIERWSGELITLLGDAAHPMLPFMAQGANQAIEDAVVLASCLRDVANTEYIPAALRKYERVRKARTAEVQRGSRGNAQTFHLSDGHHQQRRDTALDDEADLYNREWLYGYDAESALWSS